MILDKVAAFAVVVFTVSVYTVLGLCGRTIRKLFKRRNYNQDTTEASHWLVKKNDKQD